MRYAKVQWDINNFISFRLKLPGLGTGTWDRGPLVRNHTEHPKKPHKTSLSSTLLLFLFYLYLSVLQVSFLEKHFLSENMHVTSGTNPKQSVQCCCATQSNTLIAVLSCCIGNKPTAKNTFFIRLVLLKKGNTEPMFIFLFKDFNKFPKRRMKDENFFLLHSFMTITNLRAPVEKAEHTRKSYYFF